MSTDRSMKVVVKDAEMLADVVLSKSDGGRFLDRALRERLAETAPGADISVEVQRYPGLAAYGKELADLGDHDSAPDIVILSIAAEMEDLKGLDDPKAAVEGVRTKLVEVIQLVKEKLGAHILVANVSTLDPDNPVFTYHGLDTQPWTLRGHRMNLMLTGVSHDEGVSIVDVDRKIAELGGDQGVSGAARYTESGCEIIVDEIARIIEDYGFLDDRPIMEQVGAAPGKSS